MWSEINPYAIVEPNCENWFGAYVWCDILCSQLIGQFTFEGSLIGDIRCTISARRTASIIGNLATQAVYF